MDDRSQSARPSPFLFSLIHQQFQEVELLLEFSEALKGFNKERAERMDAKERWTWRPELRMRWKWTPRLDVTGVQNRGREGNGRHTWT